jgi:hypothetical protein
MIKERCGDDVLNNLVGGNQFQTDFGLISDWTWLQTARIAT